MTQSDAYRANYDVTSEAQASTVWVDASQLASKPMVAQRIETLQADALAMLALTPGLILRQLDEDRAFAREHDDSAVALKATEATADLGGDLLGRRRHVVDSRSLSIDVQAAAMSPEQLASLSELGRQARQLRDGTD